MTLTKSYSVIFPGTVEKLWYPCFPCGFVVATIIEWYIMPHLLHSPFGIYFLALAMKKSLGSSPPHVLMTYVLATIIEWYIMPHLLHSPFEIYFWVLAMKKNLGSSPPYIHMAQQSSEARACQPTAGLNFTCRQTEVTIHPASLADTYGQHIRFLSRFSLSRSELQLQISSYPNSSRWSLASIP